MVIADFQVLYLDPYVYPNIYVHTYVFRRTLVKEGCSRECVKNVCNEETKLPPSIQNIQMYIYLSTFPTFQGYK